MTSAPRPSAPRESEVGGYRLLTRIGEGGMGVVYLARRPGGERVALKVIRPHIVGDDEARARLAREVGSLSRIRSPRVAEIVDADPWGEVPFVATRYVPGLSVHDHVREEGAIRGPDLDWFASCLVEALAAVHAVGVLHRDVKPSNVLMEGRSPVLIDFGLARVADDPKLTLTGWLLGTPGYLAPEILHGDDATTASDVHSWAATVAFAGTGHPPYGRGPSMAIMDRVRRGEHDLTGLPDPLRSTVAAALDPRPDNRPTLGAVQQRVRAQLAGATRAPSAGPVPSDLLTVPLAVAATSGADEPTSVVDRDDGAPATRRYTELAFRPVTEPASRAPDPAVPVPVPTPAPGAAPTPARWPTAPPSAPGAESGGPAGTAVGGPAPAPAPDWSAAPVGPSLAERARRTTLMLTAAAAVGAAVAAYPYLAGFALLLLAWLLRSLSLAGGAVGERRRYRGPRWYDAPYAVLSSPWHVLVALPGTVLLVLWSLGLAAAAGLLCYAAALGSLPTLAAVGVVFTGCLWAGPGGSRVRRPARRAVQGVSRRPGTWVPAMVLLAALGTVPAVAAAEGGPDWTPAGQGPLASLPDLPDLPDLPGWLR